MIVGVVVGFFLCVCVFSLFFSLKYLSEGGRLT